MAFRIRLLQALNCLVLYMHLYDKTILNGGKDLNDHYFELWHCFLLRLHDSMSANFQLLAPGSAGILQERDS